MRNFAIVFLSCLIFGTPLRNATAQTYLTNGLPSEDQVTKKLYDSFVNATIPATDDIFSGTWSCEEHQAWQGAFGTFPGEMQFIGTGSLISVHYVHGDGSDLNFFLTRNAKGIFGEFNSDGGAGIMDHDFFFFRVGEDSSLLFEHDYVPIQDQGTNIASISDPQLYLGNLAVCNKK